jgi:hypothetical protein
MSESKFTPGPWQKFSRWNERYLAVIDSTPDRDGQVVANCICHVALTNDDCVANANLIAAAPDLLAACEAFVEADNQDGGSLAYVMAIEAIKKAKGEV